MIKKRMPEKFKNQLATLNTLLIYAQTVDQQIQEHLDSVGVPYEYLTATVPEDEQYYSDAPVTEALAHINNAECRSAKSLNDSIRQIQEVYEYFINKKEGGQY